MPTLHDYLSPQYTQVPLADLAAQHRAIESEIRQAMSGVIREADFILGREVRLFEEEFASFCGVQYAVGVDSGTSALELALRAYEIGAGDEVITATNSFISSALGISHVGATPVLVDADPHHFTIDVSAIERAITPRTKAIVPVHLYGHPADMDAIRQLADRHRIIVIEDACQAHGARYKGKRAGSLGHAAAFSFYPSKNLGACGDGGMIVTNDRTVASRVQMLRNYGQAEKYHHEVRGYNHRLDSLQAAILRVKLKHLRDWNAARRRQAALYQWLLRDCEAITPQEAAHTESAWHLYVIRVKQRDALREHLAKRGIVTGIHYPVPIHLQPAYRELRYKGGDFPVSEEFAQTILSLPLYPELNANQIHSVAGAIHDFIPKSLTGRRPVTPTPGCATPRS